MSTETTAWPILTATERRILGVLVEKAKTTPDTYPLSLNALTTGCNQKSAREPLMNLSEDEVFETLPNLQGKGLVTRIQGGRVERFRHNLYDQWRVSKLEMAVLTELLLRGPQTEGELRGRASRMEAIEDIEALRAVLRPLAERKLVVHLGPEGRRGSLITHGFHDARELDYLREHGVRAEEASPPSADAGPRGDRVAELEHGLAALREEVAALRRIVESMQK